jgi:hypothetical protein
MKQKIFEAYLTFCCSRDSSVGIATGTGCTSEESGFDFRQDRRFLSFHSVETGLGAHPASYRWVPGAVSSEANTAGASSWSLTSSSGEVEAYIYFPVRLHGAVII